jgi:hypothetical protein
LRTAKLIQSTEFIDANLGLNKSVGLNRSDESLMHLYGLWSGNYELKKHKKGFPAREMKEKRTSITLFSGCHVAHTSN